MNIIGRKFAAAILAAAMLPLPAAAVRANTVSDAAYAAFGTVRAECSNMSAQQAVPIPTLEERQGIKGWKLTPDVYSASYISLGLDDDFMYAINGEFTPVVEITYFDEGYGGFGFSYDARSGNKSEFVQLEDSGEWKTKTFYLYDAYFGNRLYADDCRIETVSDKFGTSSEPVIIGSVQIVNNEKSAPVDITVNTGKTGNIFFQGDTVKFDVSYENITGENNTFNVEYIVRDYSGNDIKTRSKALSSGPVLTDSVTFYGLPYGVYTLVVRLSGNGISQEFSSDFSYARKAAQVNYHFGTNIHYDDETYTVEDAKALSDLIKNSGFGFVRSSLRWHQIEKEKGVYNIPETVRFANEYLDEIGLEMLAIVYTVNDLYVSPPYFNLDDTQLKAFENYCRYVASELRGYTDYFCMLNEINHDATGYYENEQEYVDISKAGYAGLKAGNPDAFINCGSLAGWSRVYANKTYELGILDYCDSYSMHVYAHTNGPETYYMYQAEIDHKNNLEKYDKTGTKEAWITETGWPTRVADDTADEDINRAVAKEHDSASEIQQAQWYARSMAINGDKDRIDKFFYYSVADDDTDQFDIQSNFGILHAKTYSVPYAAKPAYIAVCAYNDIIGDADFAGDMITDGSGYANKYIKSDGNEVVCVWAAEDDGQTGGTYYYETDAPYAAVYDMYGNAEYIENTSGTCAVEFSQEPVYVEAAYELPEEPEEPEDPDDPGTVFDDGIAIEQNGAAANALWFLNPEDGLDVSFKTDQPAGTSMSVICAAYNDGILKGVEIQDVLTDSDSVKVHFKSSNIIDADQVKVMVFDSLQGLKSLKDAAVVGIFNKDTSVAATVSGGICTVSGQLKSRAVNEDILATVFSEDTVQGVLTEETVAPYVLYQDQLKSDIDGYYTFSFKIPETYAGKTAMILVSTAEETIQSVIPAAE